MHQHLHAGNQVVRYDSALLQSWEDLLQYLKDEQVSTGNCNVTVICISDDGHAKNVVLKLNASGTPEYVGQDGSLTPLFSESDALVQMIETAMYSGRLKVGSV